MTVRRWVRAAVVVLAACAEPPSSPAVWGPDLRAPLLAQRRHTDALLRIDGVIGTAVGLMPDGRPGVHILLERPDVRGLPTTLDGVPALARVTGRLVAFSDPTQRQRPAPAGFSVGHPAITAGTIGARVRDALGRVYILSNNHVLANSNGAQLGDPAYQPGPFDGGTAADQIATLSDFQAITFTATAGNTIDAAIALSTVALLDNAVPSDDGYGMPNATIFGDADGDGFFDDRNALLGLNVQKYGRTTRLTHGQITGVNAAVSVCYQVSGFDCVKIARFVDQLIISPGSFSNGGDSGSLIVTDDGNLNPVGLLFAGSGTVTIANRIDLVLSRFGVTIDGFDPPPPGPLTDLAVVGLAGPGAIVQGETGTVTVTVRNFGNQDVGAFDVLLRDTTDGVTVGTQTVGGLAAGGTTNVAFAWAPATAGAHTLVARQLLADDQPANDERTATFTVTPPVTDVAVTAVNAPGSVIVGHPATISVTVTNVGNQPVTDSIPVTLRDTTAGVTIGAQTTAGLPAGAARALTFVWTTTDAELGLHALVATQGLSDDNAANDRRAAGVTVMPKPTDLALTGITAPRSVIRGDTAHILVTVSNVGEVDVSTPLTVVLTDGTAGGVTVGAASVAGLAVGAATTVDIPWHTADAALNGHILIARHTLPDDVATNNTIAIAVNVNPPPITDVAVTGVSAPASVNQGSTIGVAVTVHNVGGQHVTASFDLVLRDTTAGVVIGTQTITGGLVAGGNTTRTFNWNTTGAAPGTHTLAARHTLADANAANDQASATVSVAAPSTDVAVTAVGAPASVTQGGIATIGVTIQNVGGQSVAAPFAVVLTDATAGVTIGTQTVAGLTTGSSTAVSFAWNTAGAATGTHVLVASHTLGDDNAANDQRSASVTVNPSPTDLALATITGPAAVTVGDTAPVVVTVQHVGGPDVTSSFDVVLMDGTANVAIGTQTIAGLAAGASVSRTFNWQTAGAATGGHILIATQTLADNNASNNARAIAINVNPPSLHVGNLEGSAQTAGNSWSATAQVTAHDGKHAAPAGVLVVGIWNGSNATAGECVTGPAGTCSVTLSGIPNSTRMVSFAVTGMTLAGSVYKSSGNHDSDGSSNGFSVTVKRQ